MTALTEPADTPPFELWRPSAHARACPPCSTTPRSPGATRPSGEVGAGRGQPARLPRAPSTASASPRSTTPKFVESATESGANVFAVDYFGRPAYLAQSPQFYKQQLVGVFERVYEVGPVFRAEPHDTVRHLAEYVSLDVELGFIRRPPRRPRLLREVVAGMVDGDPRARRRTPSSGSGASCRRCPRSSRCSTSARRSPSSVRPADEPDLAPSTSVRSARGRKAEHGSDFLVVEGYPMAKRPFYTHPRSRRGPATGRTRAST